MILSLTWSMNGSPGHLCMPNPNAFVLRLGFTFSGSVTCWGYLQPLAGGLLALLRELNEHRYPQI